MDGERRAKRTATGGPPPAVAVGETSGTRTARRGGTSSGAAWTAATASSGSLAASDERSVDGSDGEFRRPGGVDVFVPARVTGRGRRHALI